MIDKYLALKIAIEKMGFEVVEAQHTLHDGTVVPVIIRPNDPEALVYAAAQVYTDRSYQRRQKLLATRAKMAKAAP
jgi:hypothetical protein